MKKLTTLKGFRFGLLLQFSVGPVCLLVFNTAGNNGFWAAFLMVLAVAFVDALYILIACTCVTTVLQRANVQRALKLFGFIILLAFGLETIAGAVGISILPGNLLVTNLHTGSFFLQGLIVTASNPLTILFWSGVFASQISGEGFDRRQAFQFGFGCVLSTLLFMTAVALTGSGIHSFLPPEVTRFLNLLVGLTILFLAIRLLWKGRKTQSKAD